MPVRLATKLMTLNDLELTYGVFFEILAASVNFCTIAYILLGCLCAQCLYIRLYRTYG